MTLKSLFTAGVLISAGMLAGRALGLLREMLLAGRFGAGAHADFAIALLIIPDFITAALIGSAASAVLIPAFAARDNARRQALFWQALWISAAAGAAASLLLFLAQLAFAFAPAIPHASAILLLVLCSLPLSAATAIITASLQYQKRLLMPAFANVIFNAVIVAALAVLPPILPVLGCAIVAAACMRLAAHVWALRRTEAPGPAFARRPNEFDRRLLRAYMAACGAGILGMLPNYAPYAVIAAVGAGVALFNYAFKLVLLPSMLGLTIIQMALLPWLARLRREAGGEAFARQARLALQLAFAVALAGSLSLSLAGPALASLCFGYGQMSAADVGKVAAMFSLGIWVLPAMLVGGLWQQILYACEDTRTPLVSSAWQAGLIVPLCAAGYGMGGEPGFMAGYILTQCVPVFIYARAGIACGITASLKPSRTYMNMALASAAAFIPLAGFIGVTGVTPLAAIAISALIGLVSLAAGLAACPEVRMWGRQCFR